jgi:hypothetical protein
MTCTCDGTYAKCSARPRPRERRPMKTGFVVCSSEGMVLNSLLACTENVCTVELTRLESRNTANWRRVYGRKWNALPVEQVEEETVVTLSTPTMMAGSNPAYGYPLCCLHIKAVRWRATSLVPVTSGRGERDRIVYTKV